MFQEDIFNMNNPKIIEDYNFIGYNDTKPPELLGRGMLADALNCFMRTKEMVKRGGYTIIGNDLGANACQGEKGVEFVDGTKELIAVFNGLIYKWTGSGSWSALTGTYTLSTTAQVDIVVANNNVYFFDGTNVVVKYNGTTCSTVAAIPKGAFARWFHNQLHVSGVTLTPSTLDSSILGDPEIFTGGASSSLGINPSDGDVITGLTEFKDELIIGKRNRIWSMTGFGTTALTLGGLQEKITGSGVLSHRSFINIGGSLLFIGFLGDKPVIRRIMRTQYGVIIDGGIVSEGIETTMNGLNKAQLGKTAAFFDGRYAWFAVPNGSSTYNNLVLTLDTETIGDKDKGWSRHTGINASVFDSFSISGTPQMYFGEASADSKAYILDTSKSDNGTAINFSVTTRRYDAGRPEMPKKFKRLYTFSKETGDFDITIDKSADGFDYDNLGTLNLGGTGSTLGAMTLDTSRLGTTDISIKSFNIAKSRNKYIQYKFYDTSATSSVSIRRLETLYQEKRRPIEV